MLEKVKVPGLVSLCIHRFLVFKPLFQKMDFTTSDFIFHTGASSQRWETQPPARETLPSEPRFKEHTSFCTQRTLCWCRSRLCEERRFYWLWRLEWLPPSHQKRIFEVLQESSWGGCETSKILRWQFVAYIGKSITFWSTNRHMSAVSWSAVCQLMTVTSPTLCH